MGGMNAHRVMALHSKVGHAPMRLLVAMALRSLDPDQDVPDYLPCVYWASPEHQALHAYGVSAPLTASYLRWLRRVRLTLAAQGAIELVGLYRRRPAWLIITGSQPSPAEVLEWMATRQ